MCRSVIFGQRKYAAETERTALWRQHPEREPVPDERQFARASRFVAMFRQIDRTGKPIRRRSPPCPGENQLQLNN
jgi:hypothetical protein